MECTLCNEQYTDKSGTTFNLRLNNHRKNLNKQNSLQANQHFDNLVTTSINMQNLH